MFALQVPAVNTPLVMPSPALPNTVSVPSPAARLMGQAQSATTELIQEKDKAMPEILLQTFDLKGDKKPENKASTAPVQLASDTMASAFSTGFQINSQHLQAQQQLQANLQAHAQILQSFNPHGTLGLSPSLTAGAAAASYGSFQLPYQFQASPTFANMQRSGAMAHSDPFSMGVMQTSNKSQKSEGGLHVPGGHPKPSEEDDIQMAMKRPRLIWTKQLHERFVEAVNKMGVDQAVPKAIMESMNVKGITRENVASHLQKYRAQLKKNKTSGGVPPTTNNQIDSSNVGTPRAKEKHQKNEAEQKAQS